MSEGVKETLCTSCQHREVCIYKLDYLNILKAIGNARVSDVKETPDSRVFGIVEFDDRIKRVDPTKIQFIDETHDYLHNGGFSSKKVVDYDFISGISVGCRYYLNRTNTYRDGDSQCLTF